MEELDGASISKSEKKAQRKRKRAKKREDRRKYGYNKKRRAENKAEAATKRKALAQMAIVGGDAKAGYSSDDSGNFSYTGADSTTDFGAADDGASMHGKQVFRGRKYDNVPDMSVPAEKLKYIQKSEGPSMYGKKHHGSSMNAYQDKEASMDDYSHEKKLKADGRYEAAHGKMANAENDFDHAHALKKDAHHDAKGRHGILKHMKKF